MRRAVFALLLLGACAAAQDVPSHPDKLSYPPLRFEAPDPAAIRGTLSTGTPTYLLEDPALPIVDLQIFVRTGSFAEPAGKSGLADLCAGLMRTGGTASFTPDRLDEELDFLAANLSVTLGDVFGTVSLSVLAKDLDRGLELLTEVLRKPAFKAEKLETLRAQALDAMKARNDSTAAIEAREANLLFYGAEFPLNRLSTKASLESISREDLEAFHKAWFHPSRFIVAGAGAFKKAELSAKLEAAFKDWGAAPEAELKVPEPKPSAGPGIRAFHKDGRNINQGRVTMGHLGVDIRHPDVQAIRVMSYILGAGGFSSRLMQKVRAEEGLAYDVRSDLRPGLAYPFPFKISFQSKSESVAYAAKLCLDELARLQKDGVSETELAAAKAFFIDAFPALFFATKLQTAATFAQAELLRLPKDYYAVYREKIAAVTPDDIRRVAREQLKPERFAWVVVGDIPTIKKGDGKRPVTLADLGAVTDVPLADPYTLERPKP